MADNLQSAGIEKDTEPVSDSTRKNRTLSTSTSSFEALDPHDPNISRLANTMFQKCADFLAGELNSTQEDYILLENMNRLAISKYSDMKEIAGKIAKAMRAVDLNYEGHKSYQDQIDALEESVNELEQAAYSLDAYSRKLEARYKSLLKK